MHHSRQQQHSTYLPVAVQGPVEHKLLIASLATLYWSLSCVTTLWHNWACDYLT